MTHAFRSPGVLAGTALALAGVAMAASGCGLGLLEGGDHVAQSQAIVRLHDHDLTIHLVAAGAHPTGPLLIYATGDAGWWGGDKALFAHMAPWGYPLAGFSARDYVHHLPGDKETPEHLAADYLAIIATAESVLRLSPDVPVVLVGKSRGSGLEVAAAAESPAVRARLQGVLAVALTGEEEYVEHQVPDKPPGTLVMFNNYDALPSLGQIRVAVIQSTRDEWLPASAAHERFGPDTAFRQFHAIDAENHNFGGKVPELYAEMDRSIAWIVGGTQ